MTGGRGITVRRRARLSIAVAFAAALVVAGVALAGSGSTADPDDVAGGFDVQTARHDNTTTDITYELDFYDPDPYAVDGGPDTSVDNFVEWNLDFDGNDTVDAILECNLNVRAMPDCDLLESNRSGNVDDAGVGTFVDTNTFRVTWSRSHFSSIPEASGRTSYDYFVRTVFVGDTSGASSTDLVPDAGTTSVNHDLAAASTTASPCVTPAATPAATPVATPCPTPVPGTSEPLPTPKATPDPNATVAPNLAEGVSATPAVLDPGSVLATPVATPNASDVLAAQADKGGLPTSGGGVETAVMAIAALVIGEGLLGTHLLLERRRRKRNSA
jgi:hypothetical protein